MPTAGVLQPLGFLAGVSPNTDTTESGTNHYVNADKVRFKNGVPEKIGGWQNLDFDFGKTIDGFTRSFFSDYIDGRLYSVFGTHTRLYALIGSRIINITPVVTTPTPAANSLDTQYDTLGADPLTSVNGSPTITVSTTQSDRFVAGDIIKISGSDGFAGIPDTSINKNHIVRSVGINEITINVGVNASSSTSGGGASVALSSGLIQVSSVAHGLRDGDRVRIDEADDTGGILAADINAEFEIRNVATDSFDIMTAGFATSSVSAAGGADTEYYEPIPIGLVNEVDATGYGVGLYGVGLYGSALSSGDARSYPRIWFMERYGNTIVMSAGNQTGIYQWDGNPAIAPVLVPNAPQKVNYAFVSNNILVTFGAENMSTPVENRIFASDLANITNWTSSLTNQVYDDDIEGAGRLVSHCPIEGSNLIFTNHKTYTFRYIGQPFIWEIQPIDENVGIIAPMARCAVKGIAFWMGLDNFYMYRGGSVEVIPSNSRKESTVLRYVFDNINWGQKSKIFAWYNRKFDEVWFHYPSASSQECDRVAVVCLQDFSWTIHTLQRTAAEYPSYKTRNPRLVNIGMLFQHEFGSDACDQPLAWTLKSPKKIYGKETANINAIIPDSIQDGAINFRSEGFLFPQSSVRTYIRDIAITQSTERVPIVVNGRFIQYSWSGNALGQAWMMGTWYEEVQKGSRE